MLDLNIAFPNGVVSYWTAVKPGPCLSRASRHAAAIHSQWPISRLQTLFDLSSSTMLFENARREFVDKLKSAHVAPAVVQKISTMNVSTMRAHKTSTRSAADLWISLPWHPLWGSAGIHGALQQLSQIWHPIVENFMPGSLHNLRVAWRLSKTRVQEFVAPHAHS